MNSFGRNFRVSIFGESHGPMVGITIDGCPAGLPLKEEDFFADLERRKGGVQKATTPRKEEDKPNFISGYFNGKTTGAPLTILFENNNTRSSDYEKARAIPRPGHADFVAHKKFEGNEDYRGGGHFSGRLTVCIVAAGIIAKKILNLTPNLSPGERGEKEHGYLTNTFDQWHFLKHHAQHNRKNATEPEEKFWQEVRNRKVKGCKFRRQHPVKGYIPDFVCLEKKLIVEIDGEYHNTEEQKKFDEFREKWLNENGYQMLSFTNEEVLNNLSRVIDKLSDALTRFSESNPPSPLERESEGEVSIEAKIIEIGGEKDIEAGLQKAIDAKDSVGGIIECTVKNLPVGLGEPFFDSVESLISHAALSIPAVKGIEFGAGFNAAKMFGSEHNDSIIDESGTTKTNNAGGVLGGITNGNDLVFRIVVKPTSSTPKPQESLNWETGKVEKFSVKGRHDLCIALRVPPVLEAVTAIVLADLMLTEQKISRIYS